MGLDQHIQQSIERNKSRKPAPLFGEGFSDEARKQTTLTKYLKLETWPAMWAALLVSGIQPPDQNELVEIPNGAMGLNNCFLPGNSDPFHEARRILFLWNCREKTAARVRPADFVAWCKTQNINTDWLNDVPLDTAAASDPNMMAKPTIKKSHRVETRKNILAAVISLAKSKAVDGRDPNSVWAELVKMADSATRPSPLLGYVDGEGVKYQKESGLAFFTLKNLRDRMKRERDKAC